jgi:glyoxylase-like metal-dependent hydrolase (beta-lactamase superfamily II)
VEDFEEVGDRVWVARHDWLDVNVTAVGGERGLLLVDTLGSAPAARDLVSRLRRVTAAPLLAVVNTHAHFDHVLGNAVVREVEPAVTLLAHEDAVAEMPSAVAQALRDPRAHGIDAAHLDDVRRSELVVPATTFASVRTVDLGDRQVELVHCGRGHTAGDVVVRVPDADVVAAGDLVEQGAPPSYGEDCWPLEWPGTVELLTQLLGAGTVVVPGHGGLVDREFVRDQGHDLGRVAQTLHDLAASGAVLQDALAHDDWPFPPDRLQHAVRRGYEQLPRSARRLPMA